MKFEGYNITDEIKRNLFKLGFVRPTDIQFKTIPTILDGDDLLAVAQTGTGKTAAFAIPVVDKLQKQKSSRRSDGIKCIVLAPTRELALQIGTVFNKISRGTKVKTFTLVGGVEQERQVLNLQMGLDILIATPGRMFDLINQGEINLRSIETLILDEADHMLDLGFIEDIKYIKRLITTRHQTLFFSATINDEIKKLANSQIKGDAVRIQISPKDPVSKNVTHKVMFIKQDDKRLFLERFVMENPDQKIIVFARTKVRVERAAASLKRADIEAVTLHGDKDQEERTEIMNQFRENEVKILIATDISARGIDIPDVTFVINYDLPIVTENYVHRVGRTGRGMNKGVALSFCSEEERDQLKVIEEFLGKQVEVVQIGKKNYMATLESSPEDPTWQQLLDADDMFQKKKKKPKGKNKKKKTGHRKKR